MRRRRGEEERVSRAQPGGNEIRTYARVGRSAPLAVAVAGVGRVEVGGPHAVHGGLVYTVQRVSTAAQRTTGAGERKLVACTSPSALIWVLFSAAVSVPDTRWLFRDRWDQSRGPPSPSRPQSPHLFHRFSLDRASPHTYFFDECPRCAPRNGQIFAPWPRQLHPYARLGTKEYRGVPP